MNRLWVPIIVFLACVGACVSGMLLHGHDGGWESGSGGTNYLLRLCDFDRLESTDCASVIGSAWGSFDVYVGSRRILVPTSLVGLVHFVAIGIWFAMLGRIPGTATWLWRATMFYLGCSLLGSAYLMGLMAFSLPEWCPLCVVAHAINVGVFAATLRLWRAARREALSVRDRASLAEASIDDRALPQRARARLAVWAVVTTMGASVSLWVYFDAMIEVRRQWRKLSDIRRVIDELRNDSAFVLREFHAQRVVNIPEISSPGEGYSVDAPRLVIFTDYECAGCRCFESRRSRLIDAAFSAGLNVEYRHAPGITSPASEIDGDRLRSCLASEAARMQGGDEAFERLHRMLFVSPKSQRARDYAALASRAGLDVERFMRDLDSPEALDRVREDVALSKRLGVTEAPALFLNGRRVPVLCVNSPVFWSAIGAELAPQQASTGDAETYARAEP